MALNVRMRESEKALFHLLDDEREDLSGFLVLGSVGLVKRGTVFDSPYKAEHDIALAVGGRPFDPDEVQKFSKIAVIGTKQKEETSGLVAMALKHAASGARVILSLENDWGGKGLDKLLTGLGCPADHFSKHKSRLVWTSSPQLADPKRLDAALEQASPHRRADGQWTQAGVFSFEKIDRGTSLLIGILNKLDEDLSIFLGYGADFGCGIGDISNIF